MKPSERVRGDVSSREESDFGGRRLVGVRGHLHGVDGVGGISGVDCRLWVGWWATVCTGVWTEVGRWLCPSPPVGIWRRKGGEGSGSPLSEEGWRMNWVLLLFSFLYASLVSAWNQEAPQATDSFLVPYPVNDRPFQIPTKAPLK